MTSTLRFPEFAARSKVACREHRLVRKAEGGGVLSVDKVHGIAFDDQGDRAVRTKESERVDRAFLKSDLHDNGFRDPDTGTGSFAIPGRKLDIFQLCHLFGWPVQETAHVRKAFATST